MFGTLRTFHTFQLISVDFSSFHGQSSTEDVADRGDELVGVVGRVDGRLPGSALVPTPGGSRGLDGLASGRARRSVVRVY